MDQAVRVKLREKIPKTILSTLTSSSPKNITFTCFSTNNSQFSPTPVHTVVERVRVDEWRNGDATIKQVEFAVFYMTLTLHITSPGDVECNTYLHYHRSGRTTQASLQVVSFLQPNSSI